MIRIKILFLFFHYIIVMLADNTITESISNK